MNQFESCCGVRPVLRMSSTFSFEFGYGWLILSTSQVSSTAVACLGRFDLFFFIFGPDEESVDKGVTEEGREEGDDDEEDEE